jgi:hypothetical protein
MIAQLSNKNSIFSRSVNNTVFVIDAPGPVTGKAVFKRFGFAETPERIAHDIVDQSVYTFE